MGEWHAEEQAKLLLIDGRDDDRQLVREALDNGHLAAQLVETRSTQEGIAAARKLPPDCVIVDAELPNHASLGVLTAIKEIEPRTPVVVIANDDEEAIVTNLLDAGAADSLSRKTLTTGALSRALRHALATGAAERERQDLIARERHAREEAEAANRAKDEFLAALSHELRTPLNAILGWARLMASGSLNGPTLQRAVATIERNALLQVRLIDELLDVSRIIAGKLTIERVPLHFSTIVEAEVEAARPAAASRHIDLRFQRAGRELPIAGDGDRLRQVVANLLSNAIKFAGHSGMVEVAFNASPTRVQLSIRDGGEGIDAGQLPHVFERFSQRERSPESRHSGLGLGLSIVKYLVEAHGGIVKASSPGPGQGATFVVELQTTEQQVDAAEYCSPDLRALEGLDVLLIDDDADGREPIATVLRNHGAYVATAGSAAAALVHFARRKPDLILSDIGMPGQDGYSLLAQMKRAAPDLEIPVIAITAFAGPDDRAKALDAGFQHHLAKPVDPDVLVATVARYSSHTPSRVAG